MHILQRGDKKVEWKIEFYKKENGNIPVKEFLLPLPTKMRAKAYSEIELLQQHGIYLMDS